MHLALKIGGSLAIPTLEKCLQDLVRRHETLRTTYSIVNDHPVQVISNSTDFFLPTISLDGCNSNELESQVKILAEKEAKEPFDLKAGPLFRIKLVKGSSQWHVLIIIMHHSIADGWSLKVLFEELSALYQGQMSHNPITMPDLAIQYADFAAWQREWLKSKNYQDHLDFWITYLNGALSPTILPLDQPRSAQPSSEGSSRTLLLHGQLIQDLKQVGTKQGISINVILLTAFALLLHKYSNQKEFIICSPVVARDPKELKNLIGYFNNIVAIRTAVSPEISFLEFAEKIRITTLDVFEHQEIPFQDILTLPTMRRFPLARVMFDFQNDLAQFLEFPGATIETLDIHRSNVHFDLALIVTEHEEEINCTLEYRTSLFEKSSIIQILNNFEFLIGHIANNPTQSIAEIPVQIDEIQQRSYHELNYPKPIQNPTHEVTEIETVFPEILDDKENAPTQQTIDFSNQGKTDKASVELRLTRIWQETLGTNRFEADDNFFDLGGHSVAVMRLFEKVKKEFGKTLSPALLFQAPTIKKLTTAILEKGLSSHTDTLMPIQPKGDKQPFFCVAWPTIHVIGYSFLARHLGKDQPLYVLQSQNYKPIHERIHGDDVETLTTEYIKAMRSVQPKGPYRLGGMCDGAFLAVDMAKKLLEHGQKVSLLAVVDTWAHPDIVHPFFWKICRAFAPFRWYARRIKSLSQMDYDEKLTFIQTFASQKFRNTLGRIIGKYDIHLTPKKNQPQRHPICEKNDPHQSKKTTKQDYSGRITLFRLRRQPYFKPRDPECGWGGRASDGVEVHVLDAKNHFSLLSEPDVQTLAEALQNSLDSEQSRDN